MVWMATVWDINDIWVKGNASVTYITILASSQSGSLNIRIIQNRSAYELPRSYMLMATETVCLGARFSFVEP